MGRQFPLKILISLVVVAACTYGCYRQIAKLYGLPFVSTIADAHTLVVIPLPYYPLPPNLQPGDRLDLRALSLRSRFAAMSSLGQITGMPGDRAYQLVVYRGNAALPVSVTTIVSPASRIIRMSFIWTSVITLLLLGGIVLLVLWRGRGRAAAGLTLWTLGALCGNSIGLLPSDVFPGIVFLLVSNSCYLLSVVGLYVMAEATVGATLTAQVRWLWRGLFIAVLVAGAATSQIAGPILLLALGWTGLVLRPFQILWAINTLIPIIMLFMSYRSTDIQQRSRLRWMLWGGTLWVLAVLLSNAQAVGIVTGFVLGGFLYVLAMLGFVYAVLRHRAVDVSVFIDRTLVYGSVTALVVGILAVTNSLVQHAALGTNASLLVQIVVPLALGVVLSQVRNYADKFVERVCFRRKYLADKALRRFANHCGGYDRANGLLVAAALSIHEKLRAPDVAIYIRNEGGYSTAAKAGELAYPASIPSDDDGLAAVRAGTKDIELSELHSALGKNGYVFPMSAQAALIVANRPGEHYAADERKLLAYVAAKVGIALQALQIQEKISRLESRSSLVEALASGMLPASPEVQSKARELIAAS